MRFDIIALLVFITLECIHTIERRDLYDRISNAPISEPKIIMRKKRKLRKHEKLLNAWRSGKASNQI